MTLQELIRDVAQSYNLRQRLAWDIVHRVLGTITTGLLDDGVVNLGELGKLELKERQGRMARNPRTGVSVLIAKKQTVSFRAAQLVRDQIAKRLEDAQRVARTFLQNVLDGNVEAGRWLTEFNYSRLAGGSWEEKVSYPDRKEQVLEALQGKLGGAFQRFELPADAWDTSRGAMKWRPTLQSQDAGWDVELALSREAGEWKIHDVRAQRE